MQVKNLKNPKVKVPKVKVGKVEEPVKMETPIQEYKYDPSVPATKGEKIQVQLIENGVVTSVKNYKSLKDFSRQCTNIEYYVLRFINEISDGTMKKKYTHQKMSDMLAQIRIFSIPFKIHIEN